MHYAKAVFQSLTRWWRDRHRQQSDHHVIHVSSAVKLDAGAPPPEDDSIARIMREHMGENSEDLRWLVHHRDCFKTVLADAIDGGLLGREMAEFLNGHAFLWKHLYLDAERDPQFMAMIERALTLSANYIPDGWHRAVKDVDENRESHAELRRKYLT